MRFKQARSAIGQEPTQPHVAPPPPPETLSQRFKRLHAELEQIACQILEQKVAAMKAAHPGLPVQNLEMMLTKHRDCFCVVAQEIIATES
jgi:hypothetical protein